MNIASRHPSNAVFHFLQKLADAKPHDEHMRAYRRHLWNKSFEDASALLEVERLTGTGIFAPKKSTPPRRYDRFDVSGDDQRIDSYSNAEHGA